MILCMGDTYELSQYSSVCRMPWLASCHSSSSLPSCFFLFTCYDAVVAGNVPLKIIGYCEASVRLPRADGSIQNVWLSNTAFVPSSTANLISTGMLHDHGIFLNERTSAFEDSLGSLPYRLKPHNRLWIAEGMSSALEMDRVHLMVRNHFSVSGRKGNRELWH